MKILSCILLLSALVACKIETKGSDDSGDKEAKVVELTTAQKMTKEIASIEESLKDYGIYFDVDQSNDQTTVEMKRTGTDEDLVALGRDVTAKDALIEKLASMYPEAKKELKGSENLVSLLKIEQTIEQHIKPRFLHLVSDIEARSIDKTKSIPLTSYAGFESRYFINLENAAHLQGFTYQDLFDHYDSLAESTKEFDNYKEKFMRSVMQLLETKLNRIIEQRELMEDTQTREYVTLQQREANAKLEVFKFKDYENLSSVKPDEKKIIKVLKDKVSHRATDRVEMDTLLEVDVLLQRKLVRKELGDIRAIIKEFNTKYELVYLNPSVFEYDSNQVARLRVSNSGFSADLKVKVVDTVNRLNNVDEFLGDSGLLGITDGRIEQSFERVKLQVNSFQFL